MHVIAFLWTEKEEGVWGLRNLEFVWRRVGLWCASMMRGGNKPVSEVESERGEGYGVEVR